MDTLNNINSIFEDYKVNVNCVSFEQKNHFDIYCLDLFPGCKVKSIEGIATELMLRLKYNYKPIFLINDGFVKMIFANQPDKIMLDNLISQHGVFSPTEIVLGIDYNGKIVSTEISKMPHLLVAGTTGSGKSIFLHSIVQNFTKTFRQIDLDLCDPKHVEFEIYKKIKPENGMLISVSNKYNDILQKLKIIYDISERRFAFLANRGYRNIQEFNSNNKEKLKYIVCVIDEFADLAGQDRDKKEFESIVCLIAAKSRAAGIHLIIATQRPSVNVITGSIKANFPSRVCFKVATSVDSRVVLDQCGAENLLFGGDGLFLYNGVLTRFQSAFTNS